MRKNILVILFTIFISGFTTIAFSSEDDRAIKIEQLPAKAQQFIKQHFSDKILSYGKEDRELFDRSYKIFFTDGTKIYFTHKGEWIEIENIKDGIPSSVIPEKILQYIKDHYHKTKVIEIEKDQNEWEVKLSSGLTLKFDKKLNFIKID